MATLVRPTTGFRARVRSFARLGKARIYQHAYGWVLAVLLLRMEGAVTSDTLPALGLLLVALVGIQWSGGAADDIGGYRDGSDAQNYAGRPAITVAKKPLLTGALTEAEAVMFSATCWVIGVASGLAAVWLLRDTVQPLAVALLLLTQVCAIQYSLGLKLSYRPLGLETTIFLSIASTVIFPYWFVSGALSTEAILTGAVFGWWFLMIVFYGNASDREGDAAVTRRTLAVLLPVGAFRIVLVGLFVVSVAMIVALFTATSLEPPLLVLLVPVIAIHAAQLYHGVHRNDLRKARFIGLISIDAGSLGLVVALALSA